MIVTIGEAALEDLVVRQLDSLFGCSGEERDSVARLLPGVLGECEHCFSGVANKYFRDGSGAVSFNPFHSGQYLIYLYYLSRAASKSGASVLADKLYYLNKSLNACDLFHQIELPKVFLVEHPVGSVMGRARFGEHFMFQQNCTVGGNHEKYPQFGDYVWLFAGATVIGDSKIGDNVFISANTFVKDEAIPDNVVVYGSSPNLTLKERPVEYFHRKSPFTAHHRP